MRTHYINTPSKKPVAADSGYSLAIGFFDGIHKGHHELIQQAITNANQYGRRSALMTFDPHPSVVLGGKKEEIFYITPLKQKLELLESLGLDDVFIVRFTSDFAKLSPEQFIDEYIIGLRVHHVIAGFDFSFGAFGKGNMSLMEEYGRGQYSVTTVPKVEFEDCKISSTRIRKLLQEGQMDQVRILLGRPFALDGVVVHGDKRGRTINFPTANIEPEEGQFIPANGVYAVRLRVQDSWYDGVCNIGYKPTVQEVKRLSIEVHLIDFDRDIYGEEVRIHWFSAIRTEQKFPSLDALKIQIAKDKETAIGILASLN